MGKAIGDGGHSISLLSRTFLIAVITVCCVVIPAIGRTSPPGILMGRRVSLPSTSSEQAFRRTHSPGGRKRNYKIQIPRLQIPNKYKNFKFEIRISKFETNSNVQNSNDQNKYAMAILVDFFKVFFLRNLGTWLIKFTYTSLSPHLYEILPVPFHRLPEPGGHVVLGGTGTRPGKKVVALSIGDL
jgi:hypothetical protein